MRYNMQNLKYVNLNGVHWRMKELNENLNMRVVQDY